jgi:transketolase
VALAPENKLSRLTLDQLCINSIRVLAMDAVQKANSGHPGMPMAMAPVAYLLFTRFMRHNPRHPKWYGRDRFVLSAGHGSMLLYATLYLSGYDLTLDDIKQFRQVDSKTPGHPENYLTPGVETTTGPLGQGFGNGVGMAIAARHISARFERSHSALFEPRIFAIVSDGDLMEGVASEAASIAGHLGLGNIIYLYDDNHITIDGSTELSFASEDVCKRFDAYGWHTQAVADANDLESISHAIETAIATKDRPSLIRVRSHIGYGSPHKQDSAEAHGKALGADEVKLTKQFYGWPTEPQFYVPDEAMSEFRRCVDRGGEYENDWNQRLQRYASEYPKEAAEFRALLAGELLPDGWDKDLPQFTPKDLLATRESASRAEQAIAKRVWALFGGAADLNESTFTDIKDGGDFERGTYGGRNLHFGIREHGMCSILNGIALFGLIPLGSSFMVFTDYCRPSIRLAAIMGLHVIYIFTHDSIGLGEDGPTHQPVEHLTSLRAIPGLTLIRPADANEAVEAWRTAITHKAGPVMLALSRQKLPTFDRSEVASASGLKRGAYVLTETVGRSPDIILLASGSEVQLAVAAKPDLEKRGYAVRVVSMSSFELFEQQNADYRDSILPPGIRRRLAIEAGATLCWYRWVGLDGDVVGLDRFGMSGPSADVMKYFNFTADHVVERALRLLSR